MALANVQTTDVAGVIAGLLEPVDVRVYQHVPDTFRPPGLVIGQPTIDFVDTEGGFCNAVWTFDLTIITTRSNDRDAQRDLSRLVFDVATALDAEAPGVLTVEPQTATPTMVTVSGQDLPAYTLTVRVRT